MIELILVAIRGLALVTNNPALGGGSSVRMQEASELLGLLGELLERGDEAHDDLVAFTKVMEGMAKQGRAPSSAEWDALRDRSDAAHDVIQEAAAATEEEEKEEDESSDIPNGTTPPDPPPPGGPEPDPDPDSKPESETE